MKIYKTQAEIEADIVDGVLTVNEDVKFECSFSINASLNRRGHRRGGHRRAEHQRAEHQRVEHRRVEHQRGEHRRVEHQRAGHQFLGSMLRI